MGRRKVRDLQGPRREQVLDVERNESPSAETSKRVSQAAKVPSRTNAALSRLFRADRLNRRSTADRTSSLSPRPRRPPMDLDDRNLVLGGPRQQSALKSLTVPASEFCERNDSPDNGTVLRAQSVHHSIRRFRVMGPGEGGLGSFSLRAFPSSPPSSTGSRRRPGSVVHCALGIREESNQVIHFG